MIFGTLRLRQLRALIATCLLSLWISTFPAAAHPSFIPATIDPLTGRNIFVLRISHGCGLAPHRATDRVVIHVSADMVDGIVEMRAFKPYAGWFVDVEYRHIDAEPDVPEHDIPVKVTIAVDRSEVGSNDTVIRGEDYGEFRFAIRANPTLPPGKIITFPTEQHCVDGSVEMWAESEAPLIRVVSVATNPSTVVDDYGAHIIALFSLVTALGLGLFVVAVLLRRRSPGFGKV